MKKIKYALTMLLIMVFAVMSFGCYMISAQKMKNVQGTYKLIRYTYTPSYERKEGYTPTTYNYIEDYGYEVYLVVTGTNQGYYVHKDNETVAYSKEVSLSYQFDAEDSSKVEYVNYVDALGETGNFGVTKNRMNYSRPAFDYTQLFTKKKMRSEAIDKDWEKVDKATDLSYVKEKLGEIKEYGYEDYAVRGVYELGVATDIATGETLADNYQYYFIALDTAKGALSATVYYALKDTPTVAEKETVAFTHTDGDWASMTINGVVWTIDSDWGTHYYNESEGIRNQISCVSTDISDGNMQTMIQNRLPMQLQ